MKLQPLPLTAEAFAPFGEVLEDKTAKSVKDINQNTTKRFHDLADVALVGGKDNGGHIGISLFRGSPRPRPIRIAMLEYHPLASQAFLPADNKEWLVVVAPGSLDAPTMSQAICFLVNGMQGVNYHPKTWHHPLLVFNEQDFWVIDRIAADDEPANANLCEYWCTEEEIRLVDVAR